MASVFKIGMFKDLLHFKESIYERLNENFKNIRKLALLPKFLLKILIPLAKQTDSRLLPYF